MWSDKAGTPRVPKGTRGVLSQSQQWTYLTTRSRIGKSFLNIVREKNQIKGLCETEGRLVSVPDGADIELWPRRLYFNGATDLLKYIQFFAAVKDDIRAREEIERYNGDIRYELYTRTEDDAIARMYADVNGAEGGDFSCISTLKRRWLLSAGIC